MAKLSPNACVAVNGDPDTLYLVMKVNNLNSKNSTAEVQTIDMDTGHASGTTFKFRLADLTIVDFLAEKQKRAAAEAAANPPAPVPTTPPVSSGATSSGTTPSPAEAIINGSTAAKS